jgi:hypothetical protein
MAGAYTRLKAILNPFCARLRRIGTPPKSGVRHDIQGVQR